MEAKKLFSGDIEKIQITCNSLLSINPNEARNCQNDLEKRLLEINSIEFSLKACNEEMTSRIIQHLINVVQQSNAIVFSQFCRLIYNLLSRQQIILQSGVETVTEYLLQSECLFRPSHEGSNEVLRALGAVLYGNGGNLAKYVEQIVGPDSTVVKLAFSREESLRSVVQCVENLCIRSPSCPYLTEEQQEQCVMFFMRVLQLSKPIKLDDIGFAKCLINALRGLQHILVCSKTLKAEFLGPLLAALKVYMLYGIPNCSSEVPTSLYPMAMSHYDPSPASNTAQDPRAANKMAASRDNTKQTDNKGGGEEKKTKKKKTGSRGKHKEKDSDTTILTTNSASSVCFAHGDYAKSSQVTSAPLLHVTDPLADYPAWSKATSSESEFSDAEGGGGPGQTGITHRTRLTYTKVRQTALACFYALVKATEKRVMFGYWPAFIPDTPGIGAPSPSQHTLFTSALKDPSPRARTGALAVLTALVDGNKQYLMAAEDSEQYRTAPFTPFSVRLGYMIKEIHRCLLLCLASEQSNLALTQIIKCIGTFIPNVPYQRLKPGLLSRVIKQIRPFMNHRDPNIRVVCLSCLGSMLSVQAPLLEVMYLLNPPKSFTQTNTTLRQTASLNTSINESESTEIPQSAASCQVINYQQQENSEDVDNDEKNCIEIPLKNKIAHSSITATQSDTETSVIINRNQAYLSQSTVDSGYHSNLSGSLGSSDGGLVSIQAGVENLLKTGTSPTPEMSPLGIPTPSIPSGLQTPTLVGPSLYFNLGADSSEMSWVIKFCVKNIAAHLLDKAQTEAEDLPSRLVAEGCPARVPARTGDWLKAVQPLPVRLESLQVLTSMCKGYFNLLRPHLFLIRDVLQYCLEDTDKSVQLHSAKFLDEIGSVLAGKLHQDATPNTSVDPDQVLAFWLPLLNKPIPNLLQDNHNVGVTSTLCDCLANIAAPVFEKLPTDKHILVITLILGLSNDEDRTVRAACVRALGVFVSYPCLRQDVMFVSDAAQAILSSMEQPAINVKIKATWSLGNLSDALVANREKPEEDSTFVDEFSDRLLLKIFSVAIKAAGDNDKIRANAVRSVGNLLRYLPKKSLENCEFSKEIIPNAVNTLVKNSTAGIMKVRWNACYALGSLLKNTALPFAQLPWMPQVLDALKSAVEGCKNAKVRINAALALSMPRDRLVYGNEMQFAQLWTSLMHSIKSCDETTNFQEFKYRDNLIQQVMTTYIHLCALLERKDIHCLFSFVQSEKDMLLLNMEKYRNLMKDNPEKIALLEKAEKNVEQLNKENKLTEKEQEILKILQDIFVLHIPAEKVQRPSSPKSAFRQTYD